MFKPTVEAALEAASVLFNLPEYRVLATVRDEAGQREVFVETPAGEAACPSCGVFTARVHQRTQQRVRDVPFDGLVTVWWIKKRWRCGETRCHRATFTESTEQVPPRARLTTRLKDRIVAALSGEVRAVDRVCGEYGVAWPTAMRQLTRARAEHVVRAADRPKLVRALGIDIVMPTSTSTSKSSNWVTSALGKVLRHSCSLLGHAPGGSRQAGTGRRCLTPGARRYI